MTKKAIANSEIKPEWTLYHETNRENVDRLLEVYKISPEKAKVLYCQRKTEFNLSRVVLFEWPNGDFKISYMTKRYGISKTNRIYHRETTNASVMYTKKKFYYIQGRHKVTQLCFTYLKQLLGWFNPYEKELDCEAYTYLVSKFGWLRNIAENPNFHHVSFNTIITKKLWNPNALLRHQYGVPLPVAKILDANKGSMSPWDFMKVWKEQKKHLINIENLTQELFTNEYLRDTTLMAEALGKKVNCAWSAKRLKLEHDKWAREVTEVILEFEPLRDLKIGRVFTEFAKFSGYELLTTNHQLIAEGKRLNHCVGTYSNNVDDGECGIYSINCHTLDLRISVKVTGGITTKKIYVSQYRGYLNKHAPKELHLEVEAVVLAFNSEGIDEYFTNDDVYIATLNDGLPF